MFIPLIQKRRSIRRFLKRAVEIDKIDLLVEAALRAPSSRGGNPWEFIVLTERNLLGRLSRAKKHNSLFLRNAPLGIVVCADPNKCDIWVEDCAIASIFIQLAAESLGLASCWIQIRERMHNETKTAEDYVSEVLNMPKDLKVAAIIAVGYPDEIKPPHGKEDLQYEKVFFNLYGRSYNEVVGEDDELDDL